MASPSVHPRKAGLHDAKKEEATSTPKAPSAALAEKANTPASTVSRQKNIVVEEPAQLAQRFSLAPLVVACGGILGTVLGGLVGYQLADFVGATPTTTTIDATDNEAFKQSLEAIEKESVYFKKAGEPVVLNPDQLTAITNSDNQYYEFTPKSVLTEEANSTFTLTHHQPNKNRQVRYQFENSSAVEGSTAAIKPLLTKIDILTEEGLNERLTLNSEGQVIHSVKTVQTKTDTFENHERRFAYDPYNPNRIVEQHTVYPATKNATGEAYHIAEGATPTSVTFYEKIFHPKTGDLQEIQVVEKTGNAKQVLAERLLLDAQGTITERYEAINIKEMEWLETRLKAEALGEKGWFEKLYNKHLTVQPTIIDGATGEPKPIGRLAKGYKAVQQWERRKAQDIWDIFGVGKLNCRTDTLDTTTMINVASAKVHPQTALRNAIDQPAFSGGDALLKTAKTAWAGFKTKFHETGGAIVEQSVGERFKLLIQAFKQTSTGQKIGLILGGIVGGALGVWALYPKQRKPAEGSVNTN